MPRVAHHLPGLSKWHLGSRGAKRFLWPIQVQPLPPKSWCMYSQRRASMRLRRSVLHRWFRSERGASLVEYALLVGLIATVCVAAVSFLGDATSDQLSAVGDSLNGTP